MPPSFRLSLPAGCNKKERDKFWSHFHHFLAMMRHIFFTPLLPSSCVRGWYLFERKKGGQVFNFLIERQRTNERERKPPLCCWLDWLTRCVCVTEKRKRKLLTVRGSIYTFPDDWAPLSQLFCTLRSFSLKKKNGPFFPSCWIVCFLLFYLIRARGYFFFLLFCFLIDHKREVFWASRAMQSASEKLLTSLAPVQLDEYIAI